MTRSSRQLRRDNAVKERRCEYWRVHSTSEQWWIRTTTTVGDTVVEDTVHPSSADTDMGDWDWASWWAVFGDRAERKTEWEYQERHTEQAHNPEDLDALGNGAVIIDASGQAMQKRGCRWLAPGGDIERSSTDIELPAWVLRKRVEIQ